MRPHPRPLPEYREREWLARRGAAPLQSSDTSPEAVERCHFIAFPAILLYPLARPCPARGRGIKSEGTVYDYALPWAAAPPFADALGRSRGDRLTAVCRRGCGPGERTQ